MPKKPARKHAPKHPIHALTKYLEREYRAYGEKKAHTPLASYLALLGLFHVLIFTTVRGGSKNKTGNAGSSLNAQDWAKLILATQKLSRIITKDWVTASLRAPFTKYVENEGNGEFSEESRGTGMREAIGDLLTCPYCIGPWVATGLIALLSEFPKEGRAVLNIFSAIAVADLIHVGYDKVQSAPA